MPDLQTFPLNMITPNREEILVNLKGSISTFDDGLRKWTEPPTLAKFQILGTDDDFLLRISSDSRGQLQSDPLVVRSTRNINSVTPLKDPPSLQIQLRGEPPHNVKIRLRFNASEDKDHFFLILKNAVDELKLRGIRDYTMNRQQSTDPPSPRPRLEKPSEEGTLQSATFPHRPAPPPPLPPKPPKEKGPVAASRGNSNTMSLLGPRGAESTRGSEVESHIEALARCVAGGDCPGASEAATILAKKKAKLSICADEIGDVPGSRSKFNLEICVEDQHSAGNNLKIRLSDVIPNMTIGFLKKMVFQEYHFPIEVQRWIIGRKLIKDSETLMELRINSSTPVYLYLISAEKAGITREGVELSRQAMMAQRMPHFPQMQQDPRTQYEMVQGSVGPGLMTGPGPRHAQTAAPRLPIRGMARTQPVHVMPFVPPASTVPKKPSAVDVGWHCPRCTLINPPTIPGCRACLEDRPRDYVVPAIDSYVMDEEEKAKQEELDRHERLMEEFEEKEKQEEAMERDSNYQQLLMADNKKIIPNTEEFECLICYTVVPGGEGVLLRECLHTFCRECLEAHILHNREPVIMCPYNDGTYTCPEALLDREIMELVSPEEFQRYLQRGLSVAESQDPNSFHCKSPDCKGFCFYDDNINFFRCPICGEENCLTCKAIHKGQNCKEYQDDLQRRAANDKAAMMTKSMLERMIQTGEAMKCPQCHIIMLKKEGCDWIQCSMCKIEVCWVTKGPRWGPAGNGDISGGCKCRVQARRCHPNCQNCH